MDKSLKKEAVVIGAGPAGLTAALELVKSDKFEVKILEKDFVVGGISKTTEYNGCKFDIGPHHFITDSKKVEDWWFDLMKPEQENGNLFINLCRFTRIYYKKHFFNYPLQPLNVLKGLSFFECLYCVFSYIKICLFPIKKVKTFQDWVTNKFGYRLFFIFFKTYTEKVWGISCNKISADWAAQRIKGFSLSKAIFYAFFGRFFKKNTLRTLSDKFYYPLFGAGTLWNRVAFNIESSKLGKIFLNKNVVGITHNDFKITSVFSCNAKDSISGAKKLIEHRADYFFSTMPIKDLILSMDPLPKENIIKAAKKLRYRGLITVNFIINKKNICFDHWLYIHDKSVKMGRIGNMNNFSLKMVDNPNHTALSLEYFTFVDSSFWKKTDDALIRLGKREIEKIGIVKKKDVISGMILRLQKAYPIYDKNYKKDLKIIFDYLNKFSNLQLMGRNGLHKYNNMDIAMLSAFKAVDIVLQSEKDEKLNKETEKIVQMRV
ncbi:NAD(P)-binding protein [Candidatus Babeliales bacterium]|nr:NAD(P)-binding protein [Candidatus Babeliales bacterium]